MTKPIFPKTHCIHGHEFTDKNTYVKPNGNRECRTCLKINKQKYRDKNRDGLNSQQNKNRKNNPEKYINYKKNWLENHLYDKIFREKQRAKEDYIRD